MPIAASDDNKLKFWKKKIQYRIKETNIKQEFYWNWTRIWHSGWSMTFMAGAWYENRIWFMFLFDVENNRSKGDFITTQLWNVSNSWFTSSKNNAKNKQKQKIIANRWQNVAENFEIRWQPSGFSVTISSPRKSSEQVLQTFSYYIWSFELEACYVQC